MKIDNQNPAAAPTPGGKTAASQADAAKAAESTRKIRLAGYREGGETRPAGEGDAIRLSKLAEQIRTAASDSPERERRVEELTAAYEAGKYKVDAPELSGKLIDEALKAEPE